MKRLLSIVALAAALTLGTGGSALAHELYVTTPNGDSVLEDHDLAKGTPRIFDADYNVIAHPSEEVSTNRSAASHGTNVACMAVPESSPVNILGGTCPKD